MPSTKDYDNVRQAAEFAKQKVLEEFFQPLVTDAFKNLCAWLPNREIELLWGMGTYTLIVGRKSKYSYTSIFDSYGSVNDAEAMRVNMRESFLDTPLYKLVELLENCHCEVGHCLHLKDMKSKDRFE